MKTLYRYSKTGQFEGMIQCKESEISSVRRYTETAPPLNYNPVTQYPRWTGQKWELEEIPQPKEYFLLNNDFNVIEVVTLPPDVKASEKYVEKKIEAKELFLHGYHRYYLNAGIITERTDEEIFALLEADSIKKEEYRKAFCQRAIRKYYTLEKELQIQRKAIMNPEDNEFIDYYTKVEAVIAVSKTLCVKDLMEA